MLGTNDLKTIFGAAAAEIAAGVGGARGRGAALRDRARRRRAARAAGRAAAPRARSRALRALGLRRGAREGSERLPRALPDGRRDARASRSSTRRRSSAVDPADGVHLTPAGHAILARAIADAVRALLPGSCGLTSVARGARRRRRRRRWSIAAASDAARRCDGPGRPRPWKLVELAAAHRRRAPAAGAGVERSLPDGAVHDQDRLQQRRRHVPPRREPILLDSEIAAALSARACTRRWPPRTRRCSASLEGRPVALRRSTTVDPGELRLTSVSTDGRRLLGRGRLTRPARVHSAGQRGGRMVARRPGNRAA